MKNKLYLILIFAFLIIIMMDVSIFAHNEVYLSLTATITENNKATIIFTRGSSL